MNDKYLGYKPNPYNPFPTSLRGQYCDVPGSSPASKGVVSIDARKAQDVINEDADDPYGWKDKVREPITPRTDWIYRLEYFEVNCTDISYDAEWNVADHAYNFRELYFYEFKEVVDYVGCQWGVGLDDFKRDYEVSVPLG